MACPQWCSGNHDTEPAAHRSAEILLDDSALLVVAWLEAPVDAPQLTELRLESDGYLGNSALLDIAHAERLADSAELFGRQLREVVATQ